MKEGGRKELAEGMKEGRREEVQLAEALRLNVHPGCEPRLCG